MIEILSNIIMYELFFFAVVTFDYFFYVTLRLRQIKKRKLEPKQFSKKPKINTVCDK